MRRCEAEEPRMHFERCVGILFGKGRKTRKVYVCRNNE